MSCASWLRLYPKRSIASHRFCGSGRLLPRLEETRRAERMTELMTGRMVPKDRSSLEQAQECNPTVVLSRHFYRCAIAVRCDAWIFRVR